MEYFELEAGVQSHRATLDGRHIWVGNRKGTGASVLLLHGGLSNSRVWKGVLASLPCDLDVWMYDRQGHGMTPDFDGVITYRTMVSEAVSVMKEIVGRSVHVVGHSDGANLSMLLAIHYPELVRSLVAISGNSDPGGISFDDFDMNEVLVAVRDDYAAIGEDALESLPAVASKIEKMWRTEPNITAGDLALISSPTLIACSDRDMIDLDHTMAIYRAIPGAQLAVIPGSTHMQIAERPELVASIIKQFLPMS